MSRLAIYAREAYSYNARCGDVGDNFPETDFTRSHIVHMSRLERLGDCIFFKHEASLLYWTVEKKKWRMTKAHELKCSAEETPTDRET